MGIVTKEAKHGEKMIEVKVRFWTNGIVDDNKIAPKQCWDSGVVRVSPNVSHGIKSPQPIPFRSLADIPRAIEDCLIKSGITVHADYYSCKYLTSVAGQWKKKKAHKK